ncbi:MAG TPA: transposase, partial [Mycobacterium sp.]|nr:transposase [Mycobacterium sp.]
ELTTYCREAQMLFSVGFDLDAGVREAIIAKPEGAWVKAIRADGSERQHSWVCEITDAVDLSGWPEGSRLIARRTTLKDGDQQSFEDYAGYRLAVFLTDQPDDDIAQLDLTHRGHARVEDRIRQGKDCGRANLPFQSFAHNQVWLWLVMLAQDLIAWTAQLCLADAARAWELKRLRYRLLHQSGRIARHARRTILRLARDWPWAALLVDAFTRLQALPPPA